MPGLRRHESLAPGLHLVEAQEELDQTAKIAGKRKSPAANRGLC